MDVAHSHSVNPAFTHLLTELGDLWPKQDADYVSE